MNHFKNTIAILLAIPIISALNIGTVGATVNENTSNINVYRYSDNSRALIYSGSAAGYENDIGNSMDFLQIQGAVIFDWDSDDYVYIEKSDDILSYGLSAVPTMLTAQFAAAQAEIGTVSTNMSILYNNKYYENILMPNQTLTVSVRLENNTNSEKSYIPYIARFDLNEKLIGAECGNVITVSANSITDTTVSAFIDGDNLSKAKIYLWEKDTQTPVHDAVLLKAEAQDYFADNFDDAEFVNFDKSLCGIINSATDVDIVKFKPNVSGVYALRFNSNNENTAVLYNSEKSMLKSTGTTDKYILYELEKDKNYYLKFTGSAESEYSVTPSLPSEIQNILKNNGISAHSEYEFFDIFSFTAESNGMYIITAIGENDVEAVLYDENFAFVSSGNLADEDVLFRISQNMQAGKKYYIMVSSQNASADYTLYVEEPLDVVSIQ